MSRPPYATPLVGETPYAVERRVLAGIPCLIERPLGQVLGLALVYHGVTASKEGNLGIFTPLVGAGWAVVLPDAVGHGERREATLTADVLGHRNFVRLCAARTALEAPELIGALYAEFGELPTAAIGISMGGYVAHSLAQREKSVGQVVVISSGGVWQEDEVTAPLAREFMEAHRPVWQACLAPPTRLLLLHGEADGVFPPHDLQATATAYRAAYEQAGQIDLFAARVFPEAGHFTTPGMRDAAVSWLTDPATPSPIPSKSRQPCESY